MMLTHHAAIHPAFTIAPIPERLFGSFVEHMGRCVYGGIFEPGHPFADQDGFRRDVVDLVTELGVRVVRYPGGNFVSGYDWEDGVGPRELRPSRLDLAWQAIETNQFGTNEFISWCRQLAVEPMLAVNLGTRGLRDACNLLEYTNHPSGTYYSDLRIAHGFPTAHKVRLWCLGNEMDGPWQIGHKTADEYGRLAVETARAMHRIDPGVELVLCGSSNAQMPTFGAWEATVLDHAYDDVDYLSLHAYYEQGRDDRSTYLATSAKMDDFIESAAATVDHVRAKKRSTKKLKLSFDEWNIWRESDHPGQPDIPWSRSPNLIEQTYNAIDAVVFGSLMMSLLRHADRVEIACLAQLVNVIAPIRAEPSHQAWRQTIFHPFALTARHVRGEVLRVERTSAANTPTTKDGVDLIDLAATHDPASGNICILAVNRSEAAQVQLDVDLRPFPTGLTAHHEYLGGTGLGESNSYAQPDLVSPARCIETKVIDGHLVASLPPVSWSMIRLSPRPAHPD